jgi:hypothetical protein
MKLQRWPFVLVLVALLGATLACGGEVSVSSAKVADAYMSTDEGGDDRTTVFGQNSIFYAQVDLQNAPDDTTLKAVWTVVEAEGFDPGQVVNESEYTTGSGLVHFMLSYDDLWPIGTYKVDIYLDGKLASTLNFSVQ